MELHEILARSMDADKLESRSQSELPRGTVSVICGTGTNVALVIGQLDGNDNQEPLPTCY